jgi:hypothetical protein
MSRSNQLARKSPIWGQVYYCITIPSCRNCHVIARPFRACEPLASLRPSGLNDAPVWYPSTATLSRTLPTQACRLLPPSNRVLVSVLLPDRARTRRTDGQQTRDCKDPLDAQLADLALRRSYAQSARERVRQPRLCGRGDPFLNFYADDLPSVSTACARNVKLMRAALLP